MLTIPTNTKQQLCIKPTGFLVYILGDKGGHLLPYKRVDDDPTQLASITDIDAGLSLDSKTTLNAG